VTAPALIFLAPPWSGDDRDDDFADGPVDVHPSPTEPRRTGGQPSRGGRRPATSVRMTRGARAAATGMKVSDADVQRCLDTPDDASPDPTSPERTRFRRGNLIVVAAADGMVLRVSRRGA
jgi:hypothetical protein